MDFRFSRQGLTPQEARLQRWFEVLPGATSWSILVGMVGLSIWKPVVAAIAVIAFDCYWLLRLFYMTIFLIVAYLRLAVEQQTDWMARVRGLDDLGRHPSEPREAGAQRDVKQRVSRWIHRRKVQALQERGAMPPPSAAIHHLVIIPVVEEGRAVIEPGLASLARQTFSPEQILVVLALEARAPEPVKAQLWAMQAAYRGAFLDVLVVEHADGRPGEARVKGANTTCAAKAAAAYFGTYGIPPQHVIVSCVDADTVMDPGYMACLTYHFLLCPERTRASFQPIPVYHNNIWEAPGLTRVLDIGSSFFQLIEATNPEKLVTFSSHSMSFQALVDVGFWPVDMISDDSAIFWKAFIHYDGAYRVVPMYVTLSMDVVSAGSWWNTIKNVYWQKRRWAWGVENFPIVLRAFTKAHRIPLVTRITHATKLFESHVAWATWAFLLTVLSWLPAWMIWWEFSDSVLYYSAPRITAIIFHLASVALITTIVLSHLLLPRQPVKFSLMKRLGLTLEWLLVPLSATCLSALPALDAQTRLMAGRYMEFWVTEKRRRGEEPSVVDGAKTAYDGRKVETLSRAR